MGVGLFNEQEVVKRLEGDINALWSNLPSQFQVPFPPSKNVYIGVEQFYQIPGKQERTSTAFVNCAKRHARSSAETSAQLVSASEEKVKKVFEALDSELSRDLNRSRETSSFTDAYTNCEIDFVQGKTKNLIIAVTAACRFSTVEDASSISYIVHALAAFYVWEPS